MNSPPHHQQGQGQRELRHHQPLAEAGRRPGAAGVAGLVLEHRDRVHPRAVERGQEPEDDRRRQRHGSGERDGVRVELERPSEEVGHGRARHERPHEAEGPVGQDQRHRPREEREQARLGQELRQEMAPRGAQRQPHRHLPGPGGRAGELQVRDVGAGDEEDGAGDAEQEQQGHVLDPAAHPALPEAAGRDLKGPLAELRQRLRAHRGLQRRLDVGEDAPVQRFEGRAGLVDGHAGREAGEEVGRVGAPVLETAGAARREQAAHGDRHEEVARHVDGRAAEPRRPHPDDGQGRAVHDEHVAYRAGRSAELGLPEVVAQDDDGMAADGPVDLGAEQAAGRRLQAQGREVGARDLRPLHRGAAALVGHVGAEPLVRGDAREDRLLALQVAEHRVAERLVARTRVVSAAGARLRSGGREVDQSVGVGHRQRAQQELAVQREDRGVRSDAEGQRQDRDAGDHRSLEHHAQRQSDVGHDLPRLVREPQAVRLPAAVLDALHAAELDPRPAPRLRWGHARPDQVPGIGVEVEAHLFVERLLEAAPPGPGRHVRAQAREHRAPLRGDPGHGRRPLSCQAA